MKFLVKVSKGFLICLIRGYQLFISPLFVSKCKFIPSCSAYAIEAIEVHGILKGTVLSGYRILRCNPWTEGGLDPVPPAKVK